MPENNARQRPRAAAVTRPPRPARRRRARIRAQLSEARLGGRPRARGRFGRAQGTGTSRAPIRSTFRRRESRSDSLAAGYPPTREALFRYDALVLANVEAHQFSRAQLEATRAFVGERGGGLLVLGARSFLRQGLAGTPLEDVLPLELSERGRRRASRAVGRERRGRQPRVPHRGRGSASGHAARGRSGRYAEAMGGGAGAGGDCAARRTAAGRQRACRDQRAGGTPRALVAVQRFGEGRSMVFTGEASWRWRMLLPATDRSYDTFWKQALRWLALPAADPIQLTLAARRGAGRHAAAASRWSRNAAFEPLRERHGRPARHLAGRARRVAPCRAGDEPGQGRTSRRDDASRSGRRLQGVGGGAPGRDARWGRRRVSACRRS